MAQILIADPDASMRQMTTESLRRFGYSLHQTDDSDQLLETLQRKKFNVILCDIDLMGKDGVELLRKIKKTLPRVSVVVMTAMGHDSTQIVKAGAFAAVPKPFDIQRLRGIVRDGIRQSKHPMPGTERAQSSAVATARRRTMFKTVFRLIMAAFVLGAGTWFYNQSVKKPVAIFVAPSQNLSGFTFGNDAFWACDWLSQTVTRHKLDATLSLDLKIRNVDWHPSALAWDGRNLWSYASWNKKMTKHQMNDDLTTAEELFLTQIDPYALHHDGDSFWFTDVRNGRIGRFIVQSGQARIIESARSPAQKPVGIYRGEEDLWTADGLSGFIYRHLPGENLRVTDVYALPDEIGNEEIHSFTSDGTSFWIGTGPGQRIYRLTKDHLKLINSNP